jgi:hypothetical protein
MNQDDTNVASYILMNLAIWIYGTIFQCDRLLAIHANNKHDRQRSIIEEEFVVISARKLVRWVNEANKKKLVPQEAFQEIIKLADIITDVRDMREHADDYIVRRKGKKQSEFLHHSSTQTGLTYSSDATATIVLSEGYLIGGRLSVQLVLEAAKATRQEFNAIVLASEKFRWLELRA